MSNDKFEVSLSKKAALALAKSLQIFKGEGGKLKPSSEHVEKLQRASLTSAERQRLYRQRKKMAEIVEIEETFKTEPE